MFCFVRLTLKNIALLQMRSLTRTHTHTHSFTITLYPLTILVNARALTHTHSRSNKVWLCLCGCFCPTVTCLVATLIHCHTLTHTLIWYIYMPKYLYLMYMIPYRTKQTRARKTKGKIVRWLALFPMQVVQNDRLFFFVSLRSSIFDDQSNGGCVYVCMMNMDSNLDEYDCVYVDHVFHHWKTTFLWTLLLLDIVKLPLF